MLLFTTPSLDGDRGRWAESTSFVGDGLRVDAGVGSGQHMVSVHWALDDEQMAEVVSPAGLDPADEPVSSFHLPPYYRWERGAFSCRFTAEWRDGAPSVTVSLRHMESLRRHPRTLVIDGRDGVPIAAIVIGTPAEAADPDTGQPSLRVDWRGWHVIDGNDPCDESTRRILATHTQVLWGQVPSVTGGRSEH